MTTYGYFIKQMRIEIDVSEMYFFCAHQTKDQKELGGNVLDFYNKIHLKIVVRLIIFLETHEWLMNGLISSMSD